MWQRSGAADGVAGWKWKVPSAAAASVQKKLRAVMFDDFFLLKMPWQNKCHYLGLQSIEVKESSRELSEARRELPRVLAFE